MVASPNFTSNCNAESKDVVQDTSTTDKHERNLEHREQLLRLQREELLIHERNTHNSIQLPGATFASGNSSAYTDLQTGLANLNTPANSRRFNDELSAVSWDDVQDISTTDKNEC